MKKIVVLLLVSIILLFSSAVIAAGPYYATVNVVTIDQTASNIEVVASQTDTNKWQNVKFIVNNAKQNEQLAILLTAMAAGKQLGITYTTSPNTIIAVKIIN